METSDKDFFKQVFSIIFILTICSLIIYATTSFYYYLSHIPKDINHFTYNDNVLSFTVPDDSNSYKLKLPEGTDISNTDKLSIVMIKEHYSRSGGNFRSSGYELHTPKEINFFINNKLTYNLNKNLELTYTFKDPATGLVVEKVFN